MVMDVVCEALVQKRFEKSDKIKAVAIIAGALILAALLVVLIVNSPTKAALAVFGIIGVAFAAYSLVTGLSVEYEYCFVNGELTVDKITNKSTRKQLVVLNVKDVEKMGRIGSGSFNPHGAGRILNCSYSDEPEEGFFLQFRDGDKGLATLIISPEEEFIMNMKPHFNQLVFREGIKK